MVLLFLLRKHNACIIQFTLINLTVITHFLFCFIISEMDIRKYMKRQLKSDGQSEVLQPSKKPKLESDKCTSRLLSESPKSKVPTIRAETEKCKEIFVSTFTEKNDIGI